MLEDMRHALLGETQTGRRDAPPQEMNVEPSAEPSGYLDTAVGTQSLVPAALPAEPVGDVLALPAQTDGVDEPPADGSPEATDSPAPRPYSRLGQAVNILLVLTLGFVLVQVSGLWNWWTAAKPPAPDVLATFDGGQITIADIEAHLRQLAGEEVTEAMRSPETMMWVVEDLVLDELVKQWASQRQPDSDETFRHTMQHVSEDLNLQSFEGQLHEGDIPVSESEIRDYYEQNRAQFGEQPFDDVREQIRAQLVETREQDFVENYITDLKENASIARSFELLDVPSPREEEMQRYYEQNLDQFRLPRQVVLDEFQFPIGEEEAAAQQDAADVLLKLRSGAAWTDLVQEFPRAMSTTGTVVAEGMREAAWDAAVTELTEGELSEVFRAENAFYLVRLLERRESRVQTFAEARPAIEPIVAAQVQDDWFAANANKTLFTLKGNRYTVGDFYQEYQEFPPTVQLQYSGPAGMKQLAERLIERLLLVQDANERLLDVQNQPLEDETRLQVLKQMLHQEEVDDQIAVADEEIQQFYDQNQASFVQESKARIRYIRIGLGNSADEAARAREQADEAYRKLNPGLFQSGEDFAAVAQEYSEDVETAANGGELPGWIGDEEGNLQLQVEQHTFYDWTQGLAVGEISPPFAFDDSLYIVQVLERMEPEILSLDEARPTIEEFLRQEKHDELTTNLQQQLLDQANFEIYWSVLDEYLKQLQSS